MSRKPPKPYEMPVSIRGVEYLSVKLAAKALGVRPNTISTLITRGREDKAGTGRGNHGKQKPPVKAIPLTIGNKTYPSTRAAARELGIPLCRIKKLRKKMKSSGLE